MPEDDEDSLTRGGSIWEKLTGDSSCMLLLPKCRSSSDGGKYGFIFSLGQPYMDIRKRAGKQQCPRSISSSEFSKSLVMVHSSSKLAILSRKRDFSEGN